MALSSSGRTTDSQSVSWSSILHRATNLAETAWVNSLSSEVSVNQGRYCLFYGGRRIMVSTEVCGTSGAGSIPVDHPNLNS